MDRQAVVFEREMGREEEKPAVATTEARPPDITRATRGTSLPRPRPMGRGREAVSLPVWLKILAMGQSGAQPREA